MTPPKLVVLKFDGDFEHQGFRVTLEIGQEGHRATVEQMGTLPAVPQLMTQLHQWSNSYNRLTLVTRAIQPQAIIYEGTLKQHIETCRQWGDRLKNTFTQWLDTDAFKSIEFCLREELNRDDLIRVLVRSQNPDIKKLPWHLWNFIDRYPSSEIVFGSLRSELSSKLSIERNKAVRILAILGHCDGIDVSTDRQLLESIPHSELTFLVEPSRAQLHDRLWTQPWDILFFAGHSETHQTSGKLYINPSESLSLEELTYSLRQAVGEGLQLAIFNSCDGLGLAHALEQVNLPQVIVMREPVPDFVAHEFLKSFLTAFSSGQSLYLAERQAREKLQGLEDQFPYASWLPIVIQNPAVETLTWNQLFTSESSTNKVSAPLQFPLSPPKKGIPRLVQWRWKSIKTAILAAVLVTCLVIGVRSQGILQASELHAYDRLVQLRPKLGTDNRLLIITVDEQDITYQDERGMVRKEGWSLSDQALAEILIQLESYAPGAIGLDIYHPYSFSPELANLIQSQNALITICEMDSPEGTPETMTPPPKIPDTHIGFSDLLVDTDGVIRRHLISMAPGDICSTSEAFSLQVAQQYLETRDIPPIQRLSRDRQQLGNFILKRFEHNSGGYQLHPTDANGYQLLLNYRYSSPLKVSLREFLNDAPTTKAQLGNLENPIVLIGVDQTWQDRHLTPVSHTRTPDISGIEIHAHMISQLVDAALAQRGILWWMPQWQEGLWVLVWALWGGLWAAVIYAPVYLGVGIAGTLGVLFTACFILLMVNGWVPLIPAALAMLLTAVLTRAVAHRRHSHL